MSDVTAPMDARRRRRRAGAPGPTTGAKRKRNSLLEWVIVIAVAMTSALVVRAFVIQQFAVDGTSMMTTLHDGDRVLVNKLSYRLHDPNRGDVVVLKTIEGVGERDLIKRVVGLPGETISIRELRVQGRRQGASTSRTWTRGSSPRPRAAPTSATPWSSTKHVFVMGDNRGGSKDSRDSQVGQIAYGDLVGRAFVVIWPISDWQWL